MSQDGLLKELLYVFCGESLYEVIDKYVRCKNALERKGLRVNVDKTKGIIWQETYCFESGSLWCLW